MRHRSNIFGLFGGSKAPKASPVVAKAAEPVAVDPMPYFERAVDLSRKIRSDHYVIHAPAKDGVGDAWYWITTFSRGGFDVSGLKRTRSGSMPKGYWRGSSPWSVVRLNLSSFRDPEHEKFVYIDAYTGEVEGPLSLSEIQTRKNTSKNITPTAVVDSVVMDLLAEPPGESSVLLAWLRKPENMDWAKGYAQSVLDESKTPSKPAPKPSPAPTQTPEKYIPVLLGGGAIGRTPPTWMDKEDISLLNHNNALIQAFSESFKHVWPKWHAYRKAVVQYIKEKGRDGASNLSYGGQREYLKGHFSGTGQFKKSAFTAPKGISKYPKMRQDDRFVPAYIPTGKTDYDAPVLLMETDGHYGLGPVAEFPRNDLGYDGVEFDAVLPSDFLPSRPSKYAEDRSIRLKYLRVTWPHKAVKLNTPEKITAFFQKANSEPPPKEGYSMIWHFEKPRIEGEAGINPFLLSYVSYRMGAMILTQPRGGRYGAGFFDAIMGYPIDQDYVQDDRPPNLAEGDKIAVVMPMRLD